MGKQKKIKLDKEQKIIFKHLKWYINNRINWMGPKDDRYLKEACLDGSVAVFSISGDPYKNYAKYWTFDCFDSLLMTDSSESAAAIMKWNRDTHSLAVDLRWFMYLGEIKRYYAPHFEFPENLDDE